VLFLGGQTTRILDKGSVEWIGPHGLSYVLTNISKAISVISNGLVTSYALYILLGFAFYLSIFTFIPEFSAIVLCITTASVISAITYNAPSASN
jgi:NADH-ubiquinone oxidoreductase chain 5